MYGVKWNWLSATPETWQFASQVEHGNFAPFIIHLALSREHDGAPSDVQVTRKGLSVTVSVLEYQRYQGLWISSKVAITEEAPGVQTIKQVWTLKGVVPSQPIAVALPQPSQLSVVSDYRLSGDNQTTDDIINVGT